MAEFEYKYLKASTGKLNKGKISAFDEADAIEKLDKKGIKPEALAMIPPDPATDPQLSYLESLGCNHPADISKSEASDLINNALKNRFPALDKHRAMAARYKAETTRYTSTRDVYRRIVTKLAFDNDVRKLGEWYAFRVYRSLCYRGTPGEIKSPDHQVFTDIGIRLAEDPALAKSLMTAARKSNIGFGWFGNYHGYQGESRQTSAYKFVENELRRSSITGLAAGFPSRPVHPAAPPQPHNHTIQPSEETAENRPSPKQGHSFKQSLLIAGLVGLAFVAYKLILSQH